MNRRGKNRSWDERERYRRNKIKKRQNILRNVWQDELVEKQYDGEENRLGKHNLACSCPMCKGERWNRKKAKREERREEESYWN